MKTGNLKTKTMSILLAIVMLLVMLPMSVFAADTKPSYVALGDSISTGYGLADKTTQGFTYLLADALDYELTNLAVDGNTAAGILTQLQQQSYKDAVAGADLITITAGGNDLMALLYQAIAAEYNKLPVAANAPITADDVLTIMSDPADGLSLTVMSIAMGLLTEDRDIYLLDDEAFIDAIADYISTLNLVLSTIKNLNEDATVMVATQYNPYVEFNGASFNASLFQVDLTPICDGMEAGVTVLNAAIQGNAATGGYIVADVKAAFDTQSGDLYVADPTALNFDFHPNAAGHAVIASTMEQSLYHYDPIVVGNQLLKHGDRYVIDSDSYAVYEGVGGKAVLRLVNFDYTVNDIADVEFLPEKGYESMNGYGSRREAIIYTHLDELEIVLEGDNSLTCNVGNLYLISSDGELTISSATNGKLSLKSEAINVRGIHANTVAVKNCELDISTTSYCISTAFRFYKFIGCKVTLISSQSDQAIPYYSASDPTVEISGCIGVAGADKDNTEPFEKLKSTYKYLQLFVPDTILDAPKNLKINGTQVSWDAVDGANGYEVEYYETEANNTEPHKLGTAKVSGTVTSYDFEDISLSRGWQYYFRVRALCDNTTVGNSEWAQSELYGYGDFLIDGKDIKDKEYLYNDGTISTAAPTDPDMGYAYYEKGTPDTLTLSNFKLTEGSGYVSSIICTGALDVRLIGNNVLSSEEDPDYMTFAVDGPPPSLSPSGMPAFNTVKITGEEGSTLTTYAEEFVFGSFLNIVVDEPVTVNTTGMVYADYLEVYGKLYADNGIFLYGPLMRGENGYISAKVSADAEWGALEFYSYEDPETSEYGIDDYLALNGGVIVDGNGDTLASGHYTVVYDDEYFDYWYTFFDPDVDTSEHSAENASKQVVICSERALISQVTVDVEFNDYDGSVTGAGEYDEGASVTLIATPGEEMKFEYWLDTSVDLGDNPTEAELRAAIVSYDATYTFTAEQDICLKAVFSVIPRINVYPILIAGTDEESLFDAQWWDVEHDFGALTPGAEQIVLPGETVEDIVTIGDKQYQFKGFIVFGNDETTDTETVELKETMTIGAMPLYNSEEYWDWFTPISDGVYAAYMEYTPVEDDGDDPQDPGDPDDPDVPNDPQIPSSPQTGDNSHTALWIALLFISGGAVITLTVCDKKRRNAANN